MFLAFKLQNVEHGSVKNNGNLVDNDGAVKDCAGGDFNVAPELENLHLGGNHGVTSANTQDDDSSLQKGAYRKLLTAKRQLMINMKYLNDKLRSVKKSELINVTSNFKEIESSYNEFKAKLNDLTDSEFVSELYEGTADLYEKCCLAYEKCKNNTSESNLSNLRVDYGLDMLEATDSASQTTELVSWTSSKIRAHQIELECQRAELQAMCDLEKEKAKAKAAAAEAAAKAAEAAAKAAAAEAEAEAEARLRVAQARLDAEEKLLSLSERGSCVTGGSRKSRRNYLGREKSHRGNLSVATDRKPIGGGDSLALGASQNRSPPRTTFDERVPLVDDTNVKLPLQGPLVLGSPSLFRNGGGPSKPELAARDNHAGPEYRSSNDGHPETPRPTI